MGKQMLVPLPSLGLLYEDGPLKGKTHIQIKEMSTAEEDLLASKDLWKNGMIIDELMKSCVLDAEVLKHINFMLVGDRNAIVLSIRAYGLGHEYKTMYTCPSCGEKTEHTFDLSKAQAKGICVDDPTKATENRFSLVLPKSGKKVEFKILTHSESKDIEELNDRYKKTTGSKKDRLVTLRLKKMILAIDSVTDGQEISEFVEKMHILDSKALKSYYEKLVPDVVLNEFVTCDKCGHEEMIDMPPIDINFFWPK